MRGVCAWWPAGLPIGVLVLRPVIGRTECLTGKPQTEQTSRNHDRQCNDDMHLAHCTGWHANLGNVTDGNAASTSKAALMINAVSNVRDRGDSQLPGPLATGHTPTTPCSFLKATMQSYRLTVGSQWPGCSRSFAPRGGNSAGTCHWPCGHSSLPCSSPAAPAA
jgi:hypothetical protein